MPALDALTPRAMSAHYIQAIRADLERRLTSGGPETTQLRPLLDHLDRLSAPPPA